MLGSGVLLVAALCMEARSLPAQTLEGRVVLGADSSGVEGVPVQLHRVTATSGAVVDSTVSSADGSFEFRLAEDSGPGALWLAAARHEGIQYFGSALHAGQPVGGPYEILVYDSITVTTPPPDLRVGIRHLVITSDPSGGFDVAEVVDVLGPSDRTLVPVPDTLTMWSSSLPASAVGPRVIEGGVPPEAVTFESGRVLLRSMISPMGARITFVYTTRQPELEIRIEHPTDRLEVVIAGLNVEVSGAELGESSLPGDPSIRRYQARNLSPGATVMVEVAGPPESGRSAWIWALIGVALLLAAAILWVTGDRVGGRLRPPTAAR